MTEKLSLEERIQKLEARNGLVPVIGYSISTFTVGFLKKRWLARRNT